MIENGRQYNEALQAQSLLDSLRKEAFSSYNWKNVNGSKADAELIARMTNYSEQGRPLPEELLKTKYFSDDSHVLEENNNDN